MICEHDDYPQVQTLRKPQRQIIPAGFPSPAGGPLAKSCLAMQNSDLWVIARWRGKYLVPYFVARGTAAAGFASLGFGRKFGSCCHLMCFLPLWVP